MCHVKDFGLDQADDSAVWSFAAKNGLTIVSKDDDFRQRSLVLGAPPKVIWLKIGNCSTEVAVQVLLSGKDRIISFRDEPEATILILSR